MSLAIEIEQAVVAYREKPALRGVSLRVSEGEFLGIFGPNGAGKTTLLHLINGLLRLAAGHIQVFGHRLVAGNLGWIRKQTGYVPQSVSIDRRMPVSALEVVLMGRYGRLGLLRAPGAADKEAAYRVMQEVGVSHLTERPFGHLSGGEQQRVLIARALTQEPRILLLDEPMASLDSEGQQNISALLGTVHRQERLTTVVVSHDAEALAVMCDRILLMREGEIVGERDPADLARTRGRPSFFEPVSKPREA